MNGFLRRVPPVLGRWLHLGIEFWQTVLEREKEGMREQMGGGGREERIRRRREGA